MEEIWPTKVRIEKLKIFEKKKNYEKIGNE
jgi:hypothetical protein